MTLDLVQTQNVTPMPFFLKIDVPKNLDVKLVVCNIIIKDFSWVDKQYLSIP